MTKINREPQIEIELRAWQRAAMEDIQKAVAADVTSTPLPTMAGWCKVGKIVKEIDEK
jgi:hypothetical protein